MFKDLWQKLQNKEYRSAFRSARVRNFLAYQIRDLREAAGLSQSELADRLNTTQGNVSRLESPSYGKHSISTLLNVADVFDVGLSVKFVPFSQTVIESDKLSRQHMVVASFDVDKLPVAPAAAKLVSRATWITYPGPSRPYVEATLSPPSSGAVGRAMIGPVILSEAQVPPPLVN
jgi:transcriptional regulator with XRE-family HTH domain